MPPEPPHPPDSPLEVSHLPFGGWLPRPSAPSGVPPSTGPRWLLAAVLFCLTFLTTTTLGAAWHLYTRVTVATDLEPWLGPTTVRAIWSDPDLLIHGLAFASTALVILLCHELGHYLACRYYRLPATLPYFLPAPVGVGTFGAFIRIRAPIRTKRQLFDVGIAGPLAGFVALLPFLLYGAARSPVVALPAPGSGPAESLLMLPGESLALNLAARLFHGPLPAGTVLELHPLAMAAWFGLLATSLNLLPLGQLDGGHILYAALGRWQRRLALPLWITLAAAGFLFWYGWLVWCVIVLVIGLHHPPVRDEGEPLGRGRRLLAWVALAILLVSFMPVPLRTIPLP